MYKRSIVLLSFNLYLFIVCFILLQLFILIFFFFFFFGIQCSLQFSCHCVIHTICIQSFLIAFMQTDSFYQMSILKYIICRRKKNFAPFHFWSFFVCLKFTATAVLSYSNFHVVFFSIFTCEFVFVQLQNLQYKMTSIFFFFGKNIVKMFTFKFFKWNFHFIYI